MKKKTILTAVIVPALLLTLTVPSVQAFAFSALSVFRVGDTKTINISLDDISQMAETAKEYAEANKEKFEEYAEANKEKFEEYMEGEYEKLSMEKPEYKTLADVDEFTAFNVNLPRELKNQEVELFATDVIEQSIPMENGESISVALSPTLVAKYENVAFIATQGINDSMSSEAKAEMWEKVLSVPILTENIRTQLEEIDPNTKDIYLPVIAGISREANLGGTTGYLYATSDMQSIMETLPADLMAEMESKISEAASENMHPVPTEHKNANAIVWTKNGVLYALVGDLSDSELVAIARSVR